MSQPIQGYIKATLQDMIAVFGEPEPAKLPRDHFAAVQWTLDGGTVLHDLKLDGIPPERQHAWHIAGWSAAAVDQVIGRVARTGRFGQVVKAGRGGRETVHIEAAGIHCRCGHLITEAGGAWMHVYNEELLGIGDHDPHPAGEF